MDYCLYLYCYSQNVSADVTSDLQVYLLELMNLSVKLRKLHKILNRTVYLIHDGNILSFCIYFIIKNILWVDISVTERGCVYGSDMQMIELFAKWRHGKEKEKDYKKKNVCTDQESQSHFFFGELPGNKCRCFNGGKNEWSYSLSWSSLRRSLQCVRFQHVNTCVLRYISKTFDLQSAKQHLL